VGDAPQREIFPGRRALAAPRARNDKRCRRFDGNVDTRI